MIIATVHQSRRGENLDVQYMQGGHHDRDMHGHACWELVIVIKGSAQHVTPLGTYPVGAGDVFILKPGQEHGYARGVNFYIVNIKIMPELFAAWAGHLRKLPGYHLLCEEPTAPRKAHTLRAPLQLSAAQLEETMVLCNRISHEGTARVPGYQAMITALTLELMVALCRYCKLPAVKKSSPLGRMAGVLAFISDHYHEGLTLPQLMQVAGMTRTKFIGEFQRATGFTPIDYVIRLRVAQAAVLLKETAKLGVTEAAFRVGFENSAYFTRQFTRIMGMTPRAFRTREGKGRR